MVQYLTSQTQSIERSIKYPLKHNIPLPGIDAAQWLTSPSAQAYSIKVNIHHVNRRWRSIRGSIRVLGATTGVPVPALFLVGGSWISISIGSCSRVLDHLIPTPSLTWLTSAGTDEQRSWWDFQVNICSSDDGRTGDIKGGRFLFWIFGVESGCL